MENPPADQGFGPGGKQGDSAGPFKWGGLDFDWEYPGGGGNDYEFDAVKYAADAPNYVKLIQESRVALDAKFTDHKEITIASGMGPRVLDFMAGLHANSSDKTDYLKQMCDNLDYVNMMTYDFSGSWNTKAAFHNAPVFKSTEANTMTELSGSGKTFTAPPSTSVKDFDRFNIDEAIDVFLNSGCDKKKLIMGTGFYGRSWGKSPGLLKPAQGTVAGCGTWVWQGQGFGSMEYSDIKHRYDPTINATAKADGWEKYHDEVSKAAWLYNPSVQGGMYISYDDAWSMQEKVKYAKAKGLGGLMIWELSGDRDEELLDIMIDNWCVRRLEDDPVFLGKIQI